MQWYPYIHWKSIVGQQVTDKVKDPCVKSNSVSQYYWFVRTGFFFKKKEEKERERETEKVEDEKIYQNKTHTHTKRIEYTYNGDDNNFKYLRIKL